MYRIGILALIVCDLIQFDLLLYSLKLPCAHFLSFSKKKIIPRKMTLLVVLKIF